MGDSEKEDPPWKKELMMRKSAVSRTFQKGAEACHRTENIPPSEKGRIYTPKTPSPNKNVTPVIKRQLRSVSSREDKRMPGTGAEMIVRHGNLTDVNQTNSDSTFSECGRSPTFSSSQSDAFSFESDITSSCYEELEYGPGIVNKLKSRFIHLTLKETERANSMILPVSSTGKLRRYASLEGLVDNNISLKSNNVGHNSDYSTAVSSGNRGSYYQNYNARRSNMKKARSMDNLGSSNLDRPLYSSINKSNTYDCDLGKRNINPILINENVVIIESIGNKRDCDKFHDIDLKSISKKPVIEVCKPYGIEDNEMPKPDTVKTFKQLFEAKKSSPNGSNIQTVKQKIPKLPSPNVNDVSPSTKTCDKSVHGYIEDEKNHTTSPDSPKSKPMVNGTICSAKSLYENSGSVQHEIPTVKAKEQKDEVDSNDSQSEIKLLKPSILNRASENDKNDILFTPVRDVTVSSETSEAPQNSSDKKDVPSCLTSVSDKAKSVDLNNKSSDVLKPLPSKPPKVVSVHTKLEDKPVANIKPIVNAQINDDRKNKSKINTNTKKSDPFPSKVNGASSTEEKLASALSSLPKPRSWHKAQETSTSIVFDFRDRKDVKAHISNKVAPFGCCPASKKSSGINIDGIDGEESKDYDDDEYDGVGSYVEPCNIEFEGANIISGKSALLSNRNKKLKIQFDDKATSTFEYPSESYVDSESSSPSPTDQSVIPYADDDESDVKSAEVKPKSNQETNPPLASPVNESSSGLGLKSNPALGSSGMLSSYTPNSLCKQAENYTLGISRLVQEPPIDEKQQDVAEPEESGEEEYLKPADADQTSSWSSSASSDLLF